MMTECYGRLKDAVRALKRELTALYYASRDNDCPWIVKIIAIIAVACALLVLPPHLCARDARLLTLSTGPRHA